MADSSIDFSATVEQPARKQGGEGMTIAPYLHFQGDCAGAMQFYANLFNATDFKMMRWSDEPSVGMPDSDRILHSEMKINGSELMGSDFPEGTTGEPQKAVSVMIRPSSVEEGAQYYQALLDNDGDVIMPYGPNFFASGFGMVRDKWGTHWMLVAS